jgi:N,N-dimethylformamidase beta subunit-like protein
MPQRQFRLLVLATLLFACGAQTPTYGQTIKGMQVVGYADHLSVEAGGTVRVMVSSELPRYRADIVRLIHGDTNPKGPGFKEELIEAPVTKNIQEFGAAGDEVDRLDVQLGTPPNTLLLATTLTMSNGYQHVVEEVLQSDSHQGGMVNPWVKGDIASWRYPHGGAVFSSSSITWDGSLSYNAYNNAVSKVTENVLKKFSLDVALPGARPSGQR